MLSLSIPSNDRMEISGYYVPYLMSDIISSFKATSSEKMKYQNLIDSINDNFDSITTETSKMHFISYSKVIGMDLSLLMLRFGVFLEILINTHQKY